MKSLKHNDLVLFHGKYGTIFTVRGYALKYNEDPNEAEEKAIVHGHELHTIIQEPAMLCGDPGYYEEKQARWATAIPIDDHEVVELEGKTFEVTYKGNYSNMATFTATYRQPITPPIDFRLNEARQAHIRIQCPCGFSGLIRAPMGCVPNLCPECSSDDYTVVELVYIEDPDPYNTLADVIALAVHPIPQTFESLYAKATDKMPGLYRFHLMDVLNIMVRSQQLDLYDSVATGLTFSMGDKWQMPRIRCHLWEVEADVLAVTVLAFVDWPIDWVEIVGPEPLDADEADAREANGQARIRPHGFPATSFYTVQVDSDTGLDFYKHYTRKSYAEGIFDKRVAILRDSGKRGCVTLFCNYEWVKELVV